MLEFYIGVLCLCLFVAMLIGLFYLLWADEIDEETIGASIFFVILVSAFWPLLLVFLIIFCLRWITQKLKGRIRRWKKA